MTRFVTLTAVLLPFLEIPGFVLVSYWIGIIPMLLLVVAGVVAGIFVLQRVGLNAVVQLRLAMAEGREPGHTLIDAACFALAGFLLTIPGFISDFIALALFLPWTRNYLLRRAARHFDLKVYSGGTGFGSVSFSTGPAASPPGGGTGAASRGGGVIDAEYSVIESEPSASGAAGSEPERDVPPREISGS